MIMGMKAEKTDVWAASMEDEIGGLSNMLGGLSDAGVNLDFVIARRSPDQPGRGVLFVTPLEGDDQIAAAKELGFNITRTVSSVRIEGDDKPGAGAEISKKLADAGLNLRGFSAAVLGGRYIVYIGLDSEEDADKAVEVLQA